MTSACFNCGQETNTHGAHGLPHCADLKACNARPALPMIDGLGSLAWAVYMEAYRVFTFRLKRAGNGCRV